MDEQGAPRRDTPVGGEPPRPPSGRLPLIALIAGLALVLLAGVAIVFVARDDTTAAPQAGSGATPTGTSTPGATPSSSRTPSATSATPTPSRTARPTTRSAPSGFPSAANTGWRHTGVTLKAYTGSLTITRTTSITGRDINGCLVVKAALTLKRSRIRCGGYYLIDIVDNGSVVVEDTEFDGKGATIGNCIAGNRYTARRIDCHSVGDGLRLGSNVVVEDSFVHDLVTCGECHNDGMQAVGANNVRIVHNRVENQHSQTSAIKLGNEFGALTDVLVEGNLLSGGGYTLYAGGADSNVSGIKVRNNRFQRSPAGFFPKGGYYGPVSYYANRPGNEWANNVWDDNGQTVPPAN